MTSEEKLQELEHRLGALEDELEIRQILSSYGPTVDSDSRTAASEQWTECGIYDAGLGLWSGRAEIREMLGGEFHQGLLAAGCCHQVSISSVAIDGDKAVAIGYMQLLAGAGEVFQIKRQTAQRWEFTRTHEGWRVSRRVGRLLDGSEEPRELLRGGLDDVERLKQPSSVGLRCATPTDED